MYGFNDTQNVINFKKRLSAVRHERGYTQETFAEVLGDNSRSRVSNWESTKSPTVVPMYEFPGICELLEVDPNYLLGFSDDISESDTAIAQRLHISLGNVYMLKNNEFIGRFINSLLSSDEIHDLIHNIQRVAMQGFFSESLEKTFSPYALTQLYRAYQNFRKEVFPLDMDVVAFSYYIEKELPWKQEKQSFKEFLNSVIIDERYYEMLSSNSEFMSKDDHEKYIILMVEIAKASYKHLNGSPIIELAEIEISNLLSKMIHNFIQKEVIDFKNRDK